MPHYTDLGYGITCIDANYVRPGGACCYLLEHGDQVAIIETGINATVPRIETLLAQKNVRPEQVRYVIPTHVHLDHAGGVGRLMQVLPAATLVVHPRGVRHMLDPERLVAGSIAVYGREKFDALYGKIQPVAADRVQTAQDHSVLDLAGRKLLIRHTPGHAEHHFCIWDDASKGWFSGDNFGLSYPEMAGSKGRYLIPTTTPVQFDPDKFLASLDLLMSYQPQRIYLTHFCLLENPEAMAELLRTGILAYRDIALANRHSSTPESAICVALSQRELDGLLACAPELGVAAAQQLLAGDMALNAQGLFVWLQGMDR